jgi:protein required for attachment to host cells
MSGWQHDIDDWRASGHRIEPVPVPGIALPIARQPTHTTCSEDTDIMNGYWIVVADAARARIFRREKKFSPIEELDTLLHPESRLRRDELVTDRPGQVQESHGHGESANEPTSDPKEVEAETFARELAAKLSHARAEGRFDHLVLVAGPRFLGRLRQRLDGDTRERVVAEIDKELTRADSERIGKEVDSALSPRD